jgi:hypothetical protein
MSFKTCIAYITFLRDFLLSIAGSPAITAGDIPIMASRDRIPGVVTYTPQFPCDIVAITKNAFSDESSGRDSLCLSASTNGCIACAIRYW